MKMPRNISARYAKGELVCLIVSMCKDKTSFSARINLSDHDNDVELALNAALERRGEMALNLFGNANANARKERRFKKSK